MIHQPTVITQDLADQIGGYPEAGGLVTFGGMLLIGNSNITSRCTPEDARHRLEAVATVMLERYGKNHAEGVKEESDDSRRARSDIGKLIRDEVGETALWWRVNVPETRMERLHKAFGAFPLWVVGSGGEQRYFGLGFTNKNHESRQPCYVELSKTPFWRDRLARGHDISKIIEQSLTRESRPNTAHYTSVRDQREQNLKTLEKRSIDRVVRSVLELKPGLQIYSSDLQTYRSLLMNEHARDSDFSYSGLESNDIEDSYDAAVRARMLAIDLHAQGQAGGDGLNEHGSLPGIKPDDKGFYPMDNAIITLYHRFKFWGCCIRMIHTQDLLLGYVSSAPVSTDDVISSREELEKMNYNLKPGWIHWDDAQENRPEVTRLCFSSIRCYEPNIVKLSERIYGDGSAANIEEAKTVVRRALLSSMNEIVRGLKRDGYGIEELYLFMHDPFVRHWYQQAVDVKTVHDDLRSKKYVFDDERLGVVRLSEMDERGWPRMEFAGTADD